MNSRSLEKVRAAAQFIGSQPEAVQLARPHLHSSVQQALDILEQLLNGQWRTAEEIGEVLGINRESTRQILNALKWNPEDGGIVLLSNGGNVKESGWCLPNGKIVWKPGEKLK